MQKRIKELEVCFKKTVESIKEVYGTANLAEAFIKGSLENLNGYAMFLYGINEEEANKLTKSIDVYIQAQAEMEEIREKLIGFVERIETFFEMKELYFHHSVINNYDPYAAYCWALETDYEELPSVVDAMGPKIDKRTIKALDILDKVDARIVANAEIIGVSPVPVCEIRNLAIKAKAKYYEYTEKIINAFNKIGEEEPDNR